jgi:hypothetical protein
MAQETVSPLARAWLAVSLRLHGASAQPAAEAAPSPDVMITAIEALAAPEGNHQLLKTGGPA